MNSISLVELSVKNRMEILHEREMAYLSMYFKNMAKEIGVSVIQLAQMNRQGINEPMSSDLADTIAIARDSDFHFTICKPIDQGKEFIALGERQVSVKDNNFLLTLSNSRRTKTDSGELLDITIFL